MTRRAIEVDDYVGKRLKLRRVSLGLSQEKLGKLLNITFQQIQKYEKGVNRVSSGKLYELSKILNVPVNYFFDGYKDESHVIKKFKNFNYDHLNKEILVIARLLNQITDKRKRRSFIDAIKNLLRFMK